MKYLFIAGSPRKNGDGAQAIEILKQILEKNGDEVEVFPVYKQKVKPCTACMACRKGKVPYCTQKDSFTKLIPELLESDCVIFSSPVYFGQITGPLKNFIDRLFTFVRPDFSIRQIKNKKFGTIVTSGAPEDAFMSVTEYLQDWFANFFKMKPVLKITIGNRMDDSILPEKVQSAIQQIGIDLIETMKPAEFEEE